jgi:hypothetical protein
MEQVEKLRARRFGGLVVADESHLARRKLEADRCPVDQDGAAAAQASGTSTRMSPSTGPRPQRHGGDPLRAADRLPVERVGRNWDLFVRLGISQISRVARLLAFFHEFWRQGLLAYDDAKGIDWNWLSLDGAMTKAPLGGGKRPGPTLRIAARTGPSAASSPMARAFPSASRLTGQIATTTSSWPRPSRASRWTVLGPRARIRRGSVSTRATTTPRLAQSELRLVSRFICEAEAKRRRNWNASRA